jgi:hypothetical protein
MSGATGTTPVVMGIIDDGIAFAHERFRRRVGGAESSRVEYWWLQDGVWQGSPNVGYGAEMQKPAIDALLLQCTRAGVIDEEEVYRRAGLIDYRLEGHKSAAWRIAHGTHIMDLACGFDPQTAPDDRPIVCVQLPTRVTADTSGADLFPYVYDGIQYILNCADAIALARRSSPLPVVINLSYGRFAGPHDGTSWLERKIDELVLASASRGVDLRVVLPAGNSYLARFHAEISFRRAGQRATLEWRVQPDDRTPSYLEVWLPFRLLGNQSRVELTITSPTGETETIDETPGSLREWVSPKGVYGAVRCSLMAAPISRSMFLITLQPTADLDPARPTAPAGTWIVELKNRRLSRFDVVHARVQRDDSLYGFPLRGRQSYFDNACYLRYDHTGRDNEIDDPACLIRRDGTLNALSTGFFPIVMGAYIAKEKVPAKYSAAGPVTSYLGFLPPHRGGPDAMAVTEDSRVHKGILAAGSRSGSRVTMGGTSVAAPRIARWCADQLAQGNSATRWAVQARAIVDEATFPAFPPPPDPKRSGAGRIKLAPHHPLRRYWD